MEDNEVLIHNSLDTAESFLVKQSQDSLMVAMKLLQRILSCDPNNARAIQLFGACNYAIGNVDEAIKHFNSLLADRELWSSKPIEEIHGDALNSLAACYFNDKNKAEFYLKEAIHCCNKKAFVRNLDLINGKSFQGPKILVGSLFADDDELQNRWLDIQLEFLKNNTAKFDHVVCLDKETTKSFRNKTKVISVREGDHFYVHIWGLKTLMSYFRKVQDDYDYFLILDSDAFPTKPWLNNLLRKMGPTECFDSNGFCFLSCGLDYEIAAAIRSENFEVRLHASVLFMKKESLQDVDFEHQDAGTNLLNQPEKDIIIPKYELEKKHKAFPLIRTNRYNVHPLISGIYFDSFYHHGAASRSLRHSSDDYHDYQTTKDEKHYRDLLFNDPENFVRQLSGWS